MVVEELHSEKNCVEYRLEMCVGNILGYIVYRCCIGWYRKCVYIIKQKLSDVNRLLVACSRLISATNTNVYVVGAGTCTLCCI